LESVRDRRGQRWSAHGSDSPPRPFGHELVLDAPNLGAEICVLGGVGLLRAAREARGGRSGNPSSSNPIRDLAPLRRSLVGFDLDSPTGAAVPPAARGRRRNMHEQEGMAGVPVQEGGSTTTLAEESAAALPTATIVEDDAPVEGEVFVGTAEVPDE